MTAHKRRDRRDGWQAKRRPVDDPVPADVWAALRQDRRLAEEKKNA